MPLVQDRSLTLLTGSPVRYNCATDAPFLCGNIYVLSFVYLSRNIAPLPPHGGCHRYLCMLLLWEMSQFPVAMVTEWAITP